MNNKLFSKCIKKNNELISLRKKHAEIELTYLSKIITHDENKNTLKLKIERFCDDVYCAIRKHIIKIKNAKYFKNENFNFGTYSLKKENYSKDNFHFEMNLIEHKIKATLIDNFGGEEVPILRYEVGLTIYYDIDILDNLFYKEFDSKKKAIKYYDQLEDEIKNNKVKTILNKCIDTFDNDINIINNRINNIKNIEKNALQ